MFPSKFIRKREKFTTLEENVNAPYIRRSFYSEAECEAELIITGLGFYDAFFNGERITKGLLAPYISAPSDVVCYDRYTLRLRKGENVLGLILGNGMQNSVCGFVWDFDKASWRGAPECAFSISFGTTLIESGQECKCFDSPITYDDERGGESYDARLEVKGWNMPGFDDSSWAAAIPAPEPSGEKRFCVADPIKTISTLTPVEVKKSGDGYLYDFGVNAAGNPLLKISGERGQVLTMYCGELLIDGRLTQDNIKCDPKQQCQVIKYTLSGEGEEQYTPSFTYNGFRYVYVEGMTQAQATAKAITYLVQNSAMQQRGYFECSDETVNKLWELTNRSTLANFFYFPTDCPHREKNGWTGDAAVSAEQTLLNFDVDKSYEEWLVHIRAAQRQDGALPGIIPTGGWGFAWGSGPAWDCVITHIPYFTYIYRKDIKILSDNADAIDSYLSYMQTKLLPDGTAAYGLGDWCSPNRPSGDPKTPLGVTDTIVCIDICAKAKYIFTQLNQLDRAERAGQYREKLIHAYREKFVDTKSCTVSCKTQTAQATALYYGIFDKDEYKKAYKVLKELIKENNNSHDCGIIGARVIFHLLAENSDVDLALEMITDDKHPGFGNWIKRGATSLWENFPKEDEPCLSLNHHFFGDISNFFYKQLAGIRIDEKGINISPAYAEKLTYVKAWHITPNGKLNVEWHRTPDGKIKLTTD